ncbi:MAG: ABC transporter permease [Candidatus Krumholzibacteriia bacterium]
MNRTAAMATAPEPLSDVLASGVVAAATWRELARRKRLLSLGFLLMLPVIMLLAVRLWYADGAPPGLLLSLLARFAYLPILVPIVAMAVGAPAISEPVSEGTLVYFWTRPLRRHALYLGRVMAAALVGGVMVLVSQTLVFSVALVGWPEAITFALVRLHVEMTMVVLLGTITYTALFAAFGSRLKKPMVAAILFTFGWERAVVDIPQRIQEWTLQFHLHNLVHWPATETVDVRGFIESLLNQALRREPVPGWHSVLVLMGVLVGATLAGVFFLRMQQLDRQG